MRILLLVILCLVFVSSGLHAGDKSAKQIESENHTKIVMNKKRVAELWKKSPEKYFIEFILGNYILVNGKVQKEDRRTFIISQILGDNMLLVNGGDVVGPLAVDVPSTKGLIDGMATNMILVRTGEYKYTSVMGAGKTIARCKIVETIGFVQYLDLRKQGVKFPSDPQDGK